MAFGGALVTRAFPTRLLPVLSAATALGAVGYLTATRLAWAIAIAGWLGFVALALADARRLRVPGGHLVVWPFTLFSVLAGILFQSSVLTSSGSDARRYFNVGGSLGREGDVGLHALLPLWGEPSGTAFVERLTGSWIVLADADYAGVWLVYLLLGTVGHWLIASVVAMWVDPKTRSGRLLFFTCLLAPSLLYWRSEIGKDALVIFAAGVTVRVLFPPDGIRLAQSPMALGAIALCFFTRPQVALILVCGLLATAVARARLTRAHGLGGPAVALATLVAAVVVYASLGWIAGYAAKDTDVTSLGAALDQAAEQRSIGSTGYSPVVISDPLSVLPGASTVLLGPILRAPSVLSFVATVEIMLGVVLFVRRFRRRTSRLPAPAIGMMVAGGLTVVALSSSYNVGLLLRQRSLLLAFLLLAAAMVPEASERPRAARIGEGESPARRQSHREPRPMRTTAATSFRRSGTF